MLIAVIITDSPQPVVSLSSAVGNTVQGFCTGPLPLLNLCSLACSDDLAAIAIVHF